VFGLEFFVGIGIGILVSSVAAFSPIREEFGSFFKRMPKKKEDDGC
jgi:hypothetical protein